WNARTRAAETDCGDALDEARERTRVGIGCGVATPARALNEVSRVVRGGPGEHAIRRPAHDTDGVGLGGRDAEGRGRGRCGGRCLQPGRLRPGGREPGGIDPGPSEAGAVEGGAKVVGRNDGAGARGSPRAADAAVAAGGGQTSALEGDTAV